MRQRVLAGLLVALVTFGSEGYDLKNVKHLERVALSKAAATVLAREGFVVAAAQFKQIFSAYIGSSMPVYVTTDSAWHTYHILLEEGVRQLEEGQADRLLKFSRKLYHVARTARNDHEHYGDLMLYAAVGLALQDEATVADLPAEVRDVVEKTLQELKGTGPVRALSFGLRLMPERFKATSFYASSPALRGYFAARQWYALCDFRAVSAEETRRAFRLAVLIDEDRELKELWNGLTTAYDRLLAKPEDGDVARYLTLAADVLGKKLTVSSIDSNLQRLQGSLQQRLPDPKVNDQLLQPDEYLEFPRLTKGFRLFPPRQIPSAVIFQNVVDPVIPNRMFPSGVDFFATGVLASAAAKRAVTLAEQNAAVRDAILATTPEPMPDSLHGQAITLLALLQKPVPAAAPEPLKTKAWHDKQLWTQLGAWAEQRHTWALHTKLTVHYMGMTKPYPGIVAPYPAFFRGLGTLARKTAMLLVECTVLQGPDSKALARKLLRVFPSLEWYIGRDRNRPRPTEEQLMELEQALEFLAVYGKNMDMEDRDKIAAHLPELKKLAQSWAGGARPTAQQFDALKRLEVTAGPIAPRLLELAKLCESLGDIAEKQLSGAKLTDWDEACIRNYGISLAKLHFYDGNSYLSPRDDFPLVTPIFASPIREKVLYAGLARPEALYVIAKIGDAQVLHRGAVLSYREFRDKDTAITDEAWQERIKAHKVPPPPGFTRSFRQDGEFSLSRH